MTLWRVVAVTARALPFRRMYSNAFTHGRVHTDCGVCVAQDNDFELVLHSTQPSMCRDDASFRYLVVRGRAAGAVVGVRFLLFENGGCSRPTHPTNHPQEVVRSVAGVLCRVVRVVVPVASSSAVRQ